MIKSPLKVVGYFGHCVKEFCCACCLTKWEKKGKAGYLAGVDNGLQLQGRELAAVYGGLWDGQGVGDIWRRYAG